MFLYVITNLINGKRYVGIAQDYERRWGEHRTGHGSKLVYQAIQKYGIDNLEFTVVCKGTEEYVKEMEVRAIKLLDTKAHSGYNLTDGGEGSTGWKHSDETRKRMRENSRGTTGQKMAEATKRKIGESRLKYRRGKHPSASELTINGTTYPCILDASEALQIVYSTLCIYQRKLGTSVFEYPPEKEKKEVFNVNGVSYASRLEAARALGVSNTTICAACKKAGSNTFEYHGRPKGSDCRSSVEVTINGKKYGCMKEAAKDLGVHRTTLGEARRKANSDTFIYYKRGETPKT